jgi:hypothetical protein
VVGEIYSINNPFTANNKISDEDMNKCEREITIEECTEAITALPNNKSPGSDGLTANFYKAFWPKLKHNFMECVKDIEKYGEMSIEMKRGIISLLPKDGKDIRYIKNWRPISLLNTDYKIIAKLLALRLQPLLPDIIHRDQTGFIKERYIGENIRVVDDVITFCRTYNTPGFLLLLDYEKAFDTVSWRFLNYALEQFGFGENFRNYIKVLYCNINSSVLNNGHMTESFTLSRGIRQGCPISAFLFIITIELLAVEIRKNKHIKGIGIGDEIFKLLQFADDTAVFVKDKESIVILIDILKKFSKVSGLTINKGKCVVTYLGRNNYKGNLDNLGLTCSNEPFRYLGIWFSKDNLEQEYLNFRHRLEKTKNLLKMWKRRDLSLRGKVVVLKSLAVSQFVYPMSMMLAPEWVAEEIEKMFFKFLWSGKPPKISKTTIIRNLEQGGLKMPDINSLVNAMKVKWLKNIFNNRILKHNYIPSVYFNKMEITDFICCNFEIEDIPDELPEYYKQCFHAWLTLKENVEITKNIVEHTVIWFNKEIKMQNRTLFNQKWYNRGIFYLGDLIGPNKEIMSMNEICTKYGLEKIDLLQYSTIRQVYNRKWRKIIKGDTSNTEEPEEGIPFFQDKDGKLISLDHVSNNELYWNFIDLKTSGNIISVKYWHDNFNLDHDDMKQYRLLPYKCCIETKVQALQYKIINLVYPCGTKLKNWKINPTDSCHHCNEPDNITHHFYNCQELRIFWRSFNNWWLNICKECSVQCCRDVLLGIPRKFCHFEILNYLILNAKRFIHGKKNKNINIFFLDFLPDLKRNILALEQIAYKNNQQISFNNKWTEVIEVLL